VKKNGLLIKRGGGKDDEPAIPILLKELEEESNSIILAVDGPYGPLHQIKTVCVELARETGAPIVHVEYICSRAKEIESGWDKRIVPALFDKITVKYHPPIYVEKNDQDENETICHRLEKQLSQQKLK
jgi:lysophospholipid acyltransferase (LPLAT)-like uncharacterized protein